ncbi:MAG: TrkA C-terminal domain-containing protein [bacterium]|nr:TrkA C-terminal domain-containing protein [bacterium]
MIETIKEEEVKINTKSGIVGKTISEIEKEFQVCIVELKNLSDRAFVFSWEEKPEKSTTIKPEDEIVVSGEPLNIKQFSKAASLN